MNPTLSTGGLSSKSCRAGSLLFVLLLLVAQGACRPSTDEADGDEALSLDTVFGAVDNVEFHHVKIVDGVMHEDHPVVMYKEDFVSEDYEPKKNETKTEHKKYRHIQRQRHRRPEQEKLQKASQQEKIYFDILPEVPIVTDDDDNAKLDFEVDELVPPSKEEWLTKRPKKYHSRQRREANAYYRKADTDIDHYLYRRPQQPLYYRPEVYSQTFHRYPVPGKRPNLNSARPQQPTNINNRDDFDNDVNNNSGSLWHNSNPEEADFSKYDETINGGASSSSSSNNNNNNNWQSQPAATQRPVWDNSERETPRPPIWSNSDRRPNRGPLRAPGLSGVPQQPAASAFQPQSETSITLEADPLLLYPEEPSYQLGSACHRAARTCCSRDNLSALFDCFHRQSCELSIAEILSACT